MNARLWSCLVGGLFAVPAWSDPGTFHQVEVISSAEPVAEYARMAETGHKLCNISLTAMGGGAEVPFPALPSPLVVERIWTISDGRDFVIRKRQTDIEVGQPDEGCATRLVWNEHTVIHRQGQTVAVFRDSTGHSDIQREYTVGPWDPPYTAPLGTSERIVEQDGMRLRCNDAASTGGNLLAPLGAATETCTFMPPVRFRDEFGHDLVVQSQVNVELFDGRGGSYRVVQRPQGFSVSQPASSVWDPQTYLRD